MVEAVDRMELIRPTASIYSCHQQRQIRSLFGILEARFSDKLKN